MTKAEYQHALYLLQQLQDDLDAIASAPLGSVQRGRAITRYTDTYAALGRIRLYDRIGYLDAI